MSQFSSSLLLRRALIADAAAIGATGLLLLGSPGLLDRLLGLPTAFLRGAGYSLSPTWCLSPGSACAQGLRAGRCGRSLSPMPHGPWRASA